MRILYALNTFRPHIDGVSISIERQARALASRGHAVAIVAPSPTFSDEIERGPNLTIYRLRAVRIDGFHRRVPLLCRQGIRRALDDFEPETVVVSVPFLLSRSVATAARVRGLPVVGITSMMPEWFQYNLAPLRPVAHLLTHQLWRLVTRYYNQCDHVVGVTTTALRLLSDHGLKRPATVISNGVDLSTFAPRPRDVGLAARLGIPEKPTVLYTGRLDAEKCMRVWVDAIPRVLARVDAHFVIGGEGSERSALERRVASLGVASRVSFVGFQPDAEYPRVYSLADVFAITSPVELQSIVSLEAAASGLPIVAAAAGALPELVRHGENGLLFPAGDSDALAEALISLLTDTDRRRQMGQRARESVVPHAFERTIERYERLYERVICQRVLITRPAAQPIT